MTTRSSPFSLSEANLNKALDDALSATLKKWQLTSGHTSQYWLRGYCACFAATLAKSIGKPATLSSVLANDGIVHHIVVSLWHFTIDAHGVNTKQSLLAQINRDAEAHKYSLRAVDVIPFEVEHAYLLKECAEDELRKLRACFNTSAMRHVRQLIKAARRAHSMQTEGPNPNSSQPRNPILWNAT